jgi:hypothetical protein
MVEKIVQQYFIWKFFDFVFIIDYWVLNFPLML